MTTVVVETTIRSASTGFFGTNIGIGDYGTTDYDYQTALSAALDVPASHINTASLYLYSTNVHIGGIPQVLIRAEAADNTTVPSSGADLRGRSRTSASVTWTPASWSGAAVTTPDFAAVVQEVIDRPDWAANNTFQLFLESATTGFGGQAYIGSNTPAGNMLTVDYSGVSSTQNETGGAVATVTVSVSGAGQGTESAQAGAAAPVAVSSVGDGLAAEDFTVQASVSNEVVTLTWVAPSGATGYAVERDGTVIAFDVQGTSFTDSPGTGDHTYRIGVIA